MDDEEEKRKSRRAPLLSIDAGRNNSYKAEKLVPLEANNNGLYMDWMHRPIHGRTNLGGWTISLWIAVAFGWYYSAFFGIIANLVLYFVQVWGLSNSDAANAVTTLSGTAFVFSFVGAFASDAYLGRLWTSIVFQALSLTCIGASTVAICWYSAAAEAGSSSEGQLAWARAGIMALLYGVAVTSGAAMPGLTSLGADQLAGRSQRQKSRYFTVVAMAIALGQVMGTTAVTYVDSVLGRWGLGVGLCAAEAGLGLLLTLAVAPWCIQYRPGGNPLVRIAQVLVAAARKRQLPSKNANNAGPPELYELPGHESLSAIPGCRKLPHTDSLKFLDRAALVSSTPRGPKEVGGDPWRLCTVTQVEELKCLLRVIPAGVASTCIAAMAAQMNTLFEVQAAAMNMQVTAWLAIPPASMHLFSIAGSIATGAAYNAGGARLLGRVLGPCSGRRRRQGLPPPPFSPITPSASRAAAAASSSSSSPHHHHQQQQHYHQATSLQVQGTSIFLGIVTMAVAAAVEAARLHAAATTPRTTLSVLFLVPQTLLVGVCTNLMYAGSLNFFYTEVSDGMRTVSGAVSLLFLGAGNYLSSILVAAVANATAWIPTDIDDGHVDYFYGLLAALLAAALALFLAYAHFYTYRDVPASPKPGLPPAH